MQVFFCEFLGIFQSIMERLRTAAFFIILMFLLIKNHEKSKVQQTHLYISQSTNTRKNNNFENVYFSVIIT